MDMGKDRLRRSGLVLVSVFSTIITSACGSATYSRVSPTQNPLVAQYEVVGTAGQAAPQGWVEFGPTTSYGRQTSWVGPTQGAYALPILVAGMKQNTTYHMRAHLVWPDGSTWVDQDHTFTTGRLPASLTPPKITVSQPNSSLSPASGVELLSTTGANGLQGIVADLKGNIIWYCPGAALPLKPLPNGHFIFNRGNALQELDLACDGIRNVSVAQVNQSLQANGYDFTIPPTQPIAGSSQFSHDVVVLPNGHWIVICQIAKSFSDLTGYSGTTNVVGDALVDIDTNGNVGWAWSAFDHLDVNRHPYFGLPDWTHSNALVYTPDGNLLLSMRAQGWILKIDYSNGTGSGDILWRLGPGGDFTLAGSDPSQWFYAQHYPNLLASNGSLMTLAVYDDGNYRTYSDGSVCGSSSSAPACYSRATIYQVDESTSLATPLWAYLPGFYSFWGGSIGILSNGDAEFDSSEPFPANSSASLIMEVTHTGNPQIVWEMMISGANAYRGYRIPSLYPGVTWQK
jgi:arylsulfate sulfotransferase